VDLKLFMLLDDFSILSTEYKVAEICFPLGLLCVLISIFLILNSYQYLRTNPSVLSTLKYLLKMHYQSLALNLVAC